MAERKRKIVWASAALNDYQNTLLYILGEWGNGVAERFIENVREKTQTVSLQPHIGRLATSRAGVRSVLVSKHNRSYYTVRNDGIKVLRIYDMRQNPSKNKFEK